MQLCCWGHWAKGRPNVIILIILDGTWLLWLANSFYFTSLLEFHRQYIAFCIFLFCKNDAVVEELYLGAIFAKWQNVRLIEIEASKVFKQNPILLPFRAKIGIFKRQQKLSDNDMRLLHVSCFGSYLEASASPSIQHFFQFSHFGTLVCTPPKYGVI